ncbi:MAG: beta-ketoacyl-[acyl-carrier-protein] synthase II [Rickettsiales bacterium TMED254]|nr:beta-ketoacyl-[acyl-carrier-protein] synthase II [Rickettsiales bacterium]RPF77038.1 MAG: beta-ketoacyl-[acyl-carrier-protein] synthase II [Rickettsiales bacterium TMED254]
MKRVVVTGIGMVTPLASNAKDTWELLTNSKSGINKINSFDTDDLNCKIAGQIPTVDEHYGFNPTKYMEPKDQRKVDDFILFAVAAADQAIADAGLSDLNDETSKRAGVLIGSGIGGLQSIAKANDTLVNKGPKRMSPFFIPSCLINLASGQISIKHGLKGPNHSVVTACSTGAHAIGDASRLIKSGEADIMVAGGSEAAVCRLGIAGFAAARALSTNFNDEPEKASRPWDQKRDGFVMGEGAGVVVLESLENAKKRGARIYAEIKGYGLSGDAYHITAPASDGDGGFRSMESAVNNSGLNLEEINYINAHGTSTPLGDEIELGSVMRLFKNNLNTISMSSTKSSIGHLLGAAGAVEAIFCILSTFYNIIPPTLNLENPCKEPLLIDLVPNEAKEKNINMALSNSFGFGGTNASLIVGKLK